MSYVWSVVWGDVVAQKSAAYIEHLDQTNKL